MRNFLVILVVALTASTLWADTAAQPSTDEEVSFPSESATAPVTGLDQWIKQVVFNLTLNQAQFSNWAAGGSNSLAWQTGLNANLTRDTAGINWANSAKLTYGLTSIQDQDTHISADLIDLESVLAWKTWPQIYPFVSVAALSQFGPGYDYTPTPAVQTSDFLDPGYFTEAVGLKYVPNSEFNTRLGLALKETVANQFASIYKAGTQLGLNWVTELNHSFTKTSIFSSKLDVFYPDQGGSHSVSQWNNTLTCKFTKIIN
ncbi:MAG TPA: DUF3078 domain-containing protein, partial [bacterium]